MSTKLIRRVASYAVLVLFTVFAVYPVLQVITLSLPPADHPATGSPDVER